MKRAPGEGSIHQRKDGRWEASRTVGRTKGGKHWATPWGKPTKGAKTRKNKATDKYIIRSRKAKKK